MIDQQTANRSRDQAQNLRTSWLSTGTAFDGVIAHNDGMARGAIQAMKAAGIDLATVQVGGIMGPKTLWPQWPQAIWT